jgi:hypothetical protein
MWLPNYSEGKTAAEFPLTVSGGGNISPYLLQRRNQWAELIDKMAPALKDYLDKRRSDEIANSLLASENARRAEPVLSNGQYVFGGPGQDAAGVASYNESLGYPGSYAAPQLGGTRALFLARQQKALDDQRQEDALKATDWEQKHRKGELEISRMTQPDDGTMTPEEQRRQAAEKRRQAEFDAKHGDNWTKLDRDVFATSGHHLSDWNAAQNKRIENGQFMADLPTGDTMTMGEGLYRGALGRYNALEGKAPATVLPDPDLPAQSPAPAERPDKTPRPTTQAEYDALPHGVLYYAPDGKRHRKP